MNTCNAITFSILILLVIPSSISAQNLALHKSYSLSTLPNYQYSAPASDKSSLTDGIYTKGYFWSQPTTVGWMGRRVSIDIDLGEIQPVGAISFNTVRYSKGGVNFPQNIYVFVSEDDKDFKYVGDAADTPDNKAGSYMIKKFILNNINSRGRYVLLSVIPKGKLLFCDEIEVMKGKSTISNSSLLLRKDSLTNAIDSLTSLRFEKKYLEESLKTIELRGVESADSSEFSSIRKEIKGKDISTSDLKYYQEKIGQLQAKFLQDKFRLPFLVTKYNPWDSLMQFTEPKGQAGLTSYQITVPIQGVQFGCFVLTNTNTTPQHFSFNISTNRNRITSNIQLFKVAFVPSLNYLRIPDPLIPVENNVLINPGISQMFFYKVRGIKQGYAKSTITINSEKGTAKLAANIRVSNLLLSSETNINANVWAYLNYPMLQDRKIEAARDLHLHHINTVVIPPAILPKLESDSYTGFINYITNFMGVKNFLLYMNYSARDLRDGNGEFMSLAWKNKFTAWYTSIVKLIKQNGFPNTHIFLYPYDEVRGTDIEDFSTLVRWAKVSIPGIKFYATLTHSSSIDSILPLVDIAQILTSYKGIANLPFHTCEVWTYGASGPSRALSPYNFYRLMAWRAFQNDFKGIGFWNYADEGNSKQLNLVSDPLLTPSNSYSVVYDGPGKEITSSRRWEAFRLGIEDYTIIKAYSDKYGLNAAKELVMKVTINPENVNLADSVREQMINALGLVKE